VTTVSLRPVAILTAPKLAVEMVSLMLLLVNSVMMLVRVLPAIPSVHGPPVVMGSVTLLPVKAVMMAMATLMMVALPVPFNSAGLVWRTRRVFPGVQRVTVVTAFVMSLKLATMAIPGVVMVALGIVSPLSMVSIALSLENSVSPPAVIVYVPGVKSVMMVTRNLVMVALLPVPGNVGTIVTTKVLLATPYVVTRRRPPMKPAMTATMMMMIVVAPIVRSSMDMNVSALGMVVVRDVSLFVSL